jgi:hypothetical protein
MRQGRAEDLPRARWAEAHNLSFADHWRFTPRDEDGIPEGLSFDYLCQEFQWAQ